MAKQPLPYSTTKLDLVLMYRDQFSEKNIRNYIGTIMQEKGFAKAVNIVPHNEFMEFVATYGLPNGYFITDDD